MIARLYLCVVTVLAILTVSLPASATVLFDVSWDGVADDSAGSTPVSAAIAGGTSNLPTARRHVTGGFMWLVQGGHTDPDSGTTMPTDVLFMSDTSGSASGWVEFRVHSTDANGVGQVDISLDILAFSDTAIDNPDAMRFLLFDDSAVIGSLVLNPADGSLSFVQYSTPGTVGSSVVLSGTYPLGEIFELGLSLDMATDMAEVFVNGGSRGTASLPSGAVFHVFRPDTASSSNTSKNVIDNVRIESVIPEPGSLMLLGVAGLMCLRRRQRSRSGQFTVVS